MGRRDTRIRRLFSWNIDQMNDHPVPGRREKKLHRDFLLEDRTERFAQRGFARGSYSETYRGTYRGTSRGLQKRNFFLRHTRRPLSHVYRLGI